MTKHSPKLSIKTKICEFQEANTNFGVKLQNLSYFLKAYPIGAIEDHIAKAPSLLIKIKWLILLNNLIMENTGSNFEPINQCLSALIIKTDASTSSFDKLLSEKLVIPYKLYLQKRNFFNSPAHTSENQTYRIINLIRSALSFTDFIFTIGRYMYKDNRFLGQFITTIAKDLSILYRRMKNQLNQNMMLEHAEIIEKMNEGLYNIFYNCYFSQIAARLAPLWINTQHLFKKRAQIKKPEKLSPSKRPKYMQETVILENECEIENNSVIELQQLTYEPKSTSTIESNTQKEQKQSQNDESDTRREFLYLAETLLQQMQKIESCQTIIY